MENVIIIGILLVVIVFGIIRARKHFSGGGCCSSGGGTIRTTKTLTQPKIGEKTLTIEGMTCENCEARVHNTLNRLDGVACKKISWKKKTAVVEFSQEVSDQLLKETVERLDYQVTEIR